MNIQIDQSIKIEQTQKSTVLAFSNDEHYTILIPGKVKRQLQELFRQKGQPRLFIYRTFAAGIVLLLQNHLLKFDKVIIDKEYPGKEKLVRSIIYEILTRFSPVLPQIVFEKIGRKTKVHTIAYLTAKKKRKAEKVVNLKEMERYIFRK